MTQKFTKKYFIKKFEAIPDDQWITGEYGWRGVDGRFCVLGHCGEHGYQLSGGTTAEGDAYREIIRPLIKDSKVRGYEINDFGFLFGRFGDSPKARVINSLKSLLPKKKGTIESKPSSYERPRGW